MKNKFLIFLLTLSFLACGKKEDNNKNENIKPVVYEIVGSKENSVKRTYSGTIRSEALSNLSFRVSGTINKRIADLGDIVKKGEILATLDNTEYVLNYEKALADLAKGQASFAETEANYKRSQILYLENSISKASYDSAIAQYKSAFSTVNALKEALNLAKLKLSYTQLKAPENGTIGQVKSEVNQIVSPETTIFILNSDGDRSVEFNVSQSIVGKLKQGQIVNITISSLNNKKIDGIITNIGTLSTGYGSTYPVKAKLNDANSSNIKVGMIANISLNTLEEDEDVISLPLSSIITGPNNEKYVYVVTNVANNIGISKKQKVEILNTPTSNGVIITSGLNHGDFVITKGSTQVLENQKVSLIKGEM